MSYNKLTFVLLLCLTAYNSVNADSDDLSKLLEAQFMNLTEDVKIGAKLLDVNPEDIDTVEVREFIEFPSHFKYKDYKC